VSARLAAALTLAAATLAAAAVQALGSAQSLAALPPPAARDFPIMSWDDTPTDDAQLRGMREAGLNVGGFCKAADLARVRAAGLTCLLEDPQLRAYDWRHPPAAPQLQRDLARLAPLVGDGTVLGVFLNDEPKTPELAGLGTVIQAMRTQLPGTLPFVNLFPYREGQREWYSDYAAYAETLAAAGAPFLSFDNYALSYAGMGDEFFVNLELVRRTALAHQLPFWACLQAVAHFGYLEPNDATLHLQVWSALAYGARGIEYFTYFTPERGNYRAGAVDPFGHRTATWEALRRVNGELAALAPLLLTLTSTGVYHYPDVPKESHALGESPLLRHVDMIKDEDQFVPPAVQARFLVGEFRDPKGRSYLIIVNKDLVHSFQFELDFRSGPRTLWRVNPYSGREEPFGFEQNWLAPGGGVLLRVE
jgi:hypothetical protein